MLDFIDNTEEYKEITEEIIGDLRKQYIHIDVKKSNDNSDHLS